jgi:hypothetical protein
VTQRLLEGEVIDNGDASELKRLRDLNGTLTRQLKDVLQENEELKRRIADVGAPVARLRGKLEPLYRALQEVFGDIEDVSPEESSAQPSSSAPPMSADPRTAAVWKSWKERLSPTAAKIIDALMQHGDANTQQLSILTGLHRTTIPKGIYELNKAGLINKSGGRFSLKQI